MLNEKYYKFKSIFKSLKRNLRLCPKSFTNRVLSETQATQSLLQQIWTKVVKTTLQDVTNLRSPLKLLTSCQQVVSSLGQACLAGGFSRFFFGSRFFFAEKTEFRSIAGDL